jgi:hypothetical protein
MGEGSRERKRRWFSKSFSHTLFPAAESRPRGRWATWWWEALALLGVRGMRGEKEEEEEEVEEEEVQ